MANFPSAARTALLVTVTLLLAACSTLREDFAKPVSQALPPTQETASARYIDAEREKRAPGESGFRVLTLSTNALMSRLALADRADRSLDLQYYIFENDATGQLVALYLLKAADRGVRVRLLLDDITQAEQAPMFDSLDAHENIEVRLFNPFNSRVPGLLSKSAQMLLEFRRLNRRMHNKSFIADNRVAIVGGRNIADDYFDAADTKNFRDLDLLAIGPVVQQASHAFDSYWNDEAAVPVSAFKKGTSEVPDLAALRAQLQKNARAFDQSDYAQAALEELPDGATADRRGQWFWGKAVLLADQPEKIEAGDDQAGLRIAPGIDVLLRGAKSQALMMSPYFVPGDSDRNTLVSLVKAGVDTRILTNSLASTDQPAVHSGYAAHRRDLLAGGVKLFELKPQAGAMKTVAQARRANGVTLHAKSIVIDQRYVFVGSMNMDHRSRLLNTEMGFVVDSPALAKAVVDYFRVITLPANSYQLSLEDADGTASGSGQILWASEADGVPVTHTREPGVGPLLRTEVLLMKLLPIDSLL